MAVTHDGGVLIINQQVRGKFHISTCLIQNQSSNKGTKYHCLCPVSIVRGHFVCPFWKRENHISWHKKRFKMQSWQCYLREIAKESWGRKPLAIGYHKLVNSILEYRSETRDQCSNFASDRGSSNNHLTLWLGMSLNSVSVLLLLKLG